MAACPVARMMALIAILWVGRCAAKVPLTCASAVGWRAPARPKRRKISEPGIRGLRCLAVVAAPPAAVLVGNVAPAPVRQRLIWHDPKHLDWVDPLGADRAQVRPVVAEVEDVHELFARLQPRQLDALVVLGDFAFDLPVRVPRPV